MDAQLMVVAGLVGLLTGVLAMLAFRASEREQSNPAAVPPPVLPAGAVDVLSVLRSSAVVLDASDEVVRASPTAYSYGVVRGNDIVVPELLRLARQTRADGEIRERELELPRGPLGSSTRSVLARVAPLGSTLVLLLVQDQTEAWRVDAVRRDFVANVSHELKTPVGAVTLLAEALLDAADDPEAVRRFAGRLQRETDRLSRLVQDVIDLSRLQGDDPLHEPMVVSVDDVVAEAADRSRLAADARQITVAVGGTGGLKVRGDATQLIMALGNLVDNAVRYSPTGTRVSVATRLSRTADADIVEVSVSDEGPGIPPTERDRIFERFYRVDAARSRDTGGTGIGLSIVKHIAAGHGGDVRVWSAEGAGSTFTLRLPAAHPGAATTPTTQETA